MHTITLCHIWSLSGTPRLECINGRHPPLKIPVGVVSHFFPISHIFSDTTFKQSCSTSSYKSSVVLKLTLVGSLSIETCGQNSASSVSCQPDIDFTSGTAVVGSRMKKWQFSNSFLQEESSFSMRSCNVGGWLCAPIMSWTWSWILELSVKSKWRGGMYVA